MFMNNAIYAGSFDPPTLGHAWVIEQAANLFDYLVVAIGINPEKKYTFSVEERVAMLTEIANGIRGGRNVSVEHFDGFLFKYADKVSERLIAAGGCGVKYIVRGIRSADDAKMELSLAEFNNKHSVVPRTTVFFPPPPELGMVSSSLVKQLCGPEGWQDVVRPMVPEITFRHLLRWKQPTTADDIVIGCDMPPESRHPNPPKLR